MIKTIVDKTVIPFASYVSSRMTRPHYKSVPSESLDRAIRDSVDYADEHMANALVFTERKELWSYAFAKRRIRGLVCEFGVWRGESINYFASQTSEPVYGFDSFEGLREDWQGRDKPKGWFHLNGCLPRVRDNVNLIKGWFDATLPAFLAHHAQPFSFVHVDCDTYEATKTIFSLASNYFIKDTIIVFDEYFGFRGWRQGEFKAWQEFVASRAYKYVAFAKEQVAVVIE